MLALFFASVITYTFNEFLENELELERCKNEKIKKD